MRGGLAALLAAVGVFMAVGVAPAMASPHWSDTAHGMKVSGSIQVSAEKHTTTTCTMPSTQSSYVFENLASVWTSSNLWGAINLKCTSSNEEMGFVLTTKSTSSVEVAGTGHSYVDPWGEQYTQANSLADFSNGSGGTSSTMTFSNDVVGNIGGPFGIPIYANGTLTVTTSSGGLMTIAP